MNSFTRRKVIHAFRQLMLESSGLELVRAEAGGMLTMLRSAYRSAVAEAMGSTASADGELGTVSEPKKVSGLGVNITLSSVFYYNSVCEKTSAATSVERRRCKPDRAISLE